MLGLSYSPIKLIDVNTCSFFIGSPITTDSFFFERQHKGETNHSFVVGSSLIKKDQQNSLVKKTGSNLSKALYICSDSVNIHWLLQHPLFILLYFLMNEFNHYIELYLNI